MPQVEVIPADNLIAVNGTGLVFDEPFPHEDNLKYLMWNGTPEDGYGLIQFTDDYDMNLLPPLYEEEVVPYIAIWQGEKAKRDKDRMEGEAELAKYFNSKEYKLRQLRSARSERLSLYDVAIAQLDRMSRLAETDEQKQEINDLRHQWDLYAQILCKMTDDPDSPWDGGTSIGEPYSVPWPEEPAMPASISI